MQGRTQKTLADVKDCPQRVVKSEQAYPLGDGEKPFT